MFMRRTTIIVSGLAVAALLAAAGSPASAAPPSDPFGRAVGQVRAHAASTHFEQGQTFTLKNVIMDPDGTEHVRLHRYYDGLPVLGGDLVVHLGKGNTWRGTSQSLTGSVRPSRQPTITAGAASAIAIASSTATRRTVDGVQLVVDAGDGAANLAYQIVVGGVYADATPSELHVLVDAGTGAIRDSWETVQADGVGHSFHSGDVPVGTVLSGGTYQLNDGVRGGHKTYGLQRPHHG